MSEWPSLTHSHEVNSYGFWRGSAEEGAFYAYAYPGTGRVSRLDGGNARATYDPALGEFLLPYRSVRTAPDPEDTLVAFFESTYVAAATIGDWDRDNSRSAPLIDESADWRIADAFTS